MVRFISLKMSIKIINYLWFKVMICSKFFNKMLIVNWKVSIVCVILKLYSPIRMLHLLSVFWINVVGKIGRREEHLLSLGLVELGMILMLLYFLKKRMFNILKCYNLEIIIILLLEFRKMDLCGWLLILFPASFFSRKRKVSWQ